MSTTTAPMSDKGEVIGDESDYHIDEGSCDEDDEEGNMGRGESQHDGGLEEQDGQFDDEAEDSEDSLCRTKVRRRGGGGALVDTLCDYVDQNIPLTRSRRRLGGAEVADGAAAAAKEVQQRPVFYEKVSMSDLFRARVHMACMADATPMSGSHALAHMKPRAWRCTDWSIEPHASSSIQAVGDSKLRLSRMLITAKGVRGHWVRERFELPPFNCGSPSTPASFIACAWNSETTEALILVQWRSQVRVTRVHSFFTEVKGATKVAIKSIVDEAAAQSRGSNAAGRGEDLKAARDAVAARGRAPGFVHFEQHFESRRG